jgi:hypothetical protein
MVTMPHYVRINGKVYRVNENPKKRRRHHYVVDLLIGGGTTDWDVMAYSPSDAKAKAKARVSSQHETHPSRGRGAGSMTFYRLPDGRIVQTNPRRNAVHTKRWDRCFKAVLKDVHDKRRAAAICTHAIGYKGSILKAHRHRDPRY